MNSTFQIFLGKKHCCDLVLEGIKDTRSLGNLKPQVKDEVSFDLFSIEFATADYCYHGGPKIVGDDWGKASFNDLLSALNSISSAWRYTVISQPPDALPFRVPSGFTI